MLGGCSFNIRAIPVSNSCGFLAQLGQASANKISLRRHSPHSGGTRTADCAGGKKVIIVAHSWGGIPGSESVKGFEMVEGGDRGAVMHCLFVSALGGLQRREFDVNYWE